MHPAAQALAARHDQAHADAERLRRETMTAFWRGADAQLATAATHALRAAHRLAHSLARRKRRLDAR